MKALVVRACGRADDVRAEERAAPRPGARDVLVRVRATSINPIDWKLRASPLRFVPFVPRVLGFDVSGTVEAVGRAVTAFAPGDEAFGMLQAFRGGGNAELVAAPARLLARKPGACTHLEAAAIPLAGLTALQALDGGARLADGERVLVIGASGGVGMFAVQIAKARGAHVTGVSSARNGDFVRSLGADAVLAYDREAVAGTYDVVFDAVGTYTYFSARRLLARAGRYVTTLASAANVASYIAAPLFGQRSRIILTSPSGHDLTALARLVDDGRLRVHVEKAYPLDEIAEAYARSQTGRVVGKLVLRI